MRDMVKGVGEENVKVAVKERVKKIGEEHGEVML